MRAYRMFALLSVLGSGLGLSLTLGGCEALWSGFNEGNPQSCEMNPTLCNAATQVCNTVTKLCEKKCAASTECTLDPGRPLCLNGACVPCDRFNENIETASAECKTTSAKNIRCVDSGQNKGQCLQCTSPTHCADDSFLCSAQNECVLGTCAKHSECASEVCDVYEEVTPGQRGRCLPTKEVVYVDNRDMGGCASGDGSKGSPVCTLAEGLAKIGGEKKALRLTGRTQSYGKLGTMGAPYQGTVTIYGPDEGARAKLGGDLNDHGVSLGGNASVTLDGVEVSGASIGVSCGGTARLSLRRAFVLGSANVGIRAQGCRLVIDRTQISKNGNGAIELSQIPDYLITSSFITENSSATESAIRFTDNTSQGQMLFNTIANNNTAPTVAGAIDCGGKSREIGDTIVFGNIGASSQFFGACALRNTVVGMADMVSGGTRKDPAFMGAAQGDFRLLAGDPKNTDCCLGKGQPSDLVRTDYFGTARKAKPDIGAHESK